MFINIFHKIINLKFIILSGIFTLLVLNITITRAQQHKESNWWYFGNYAGLNFSSGSPVAVTDGAMYTNQGCSTISDSSGNLLFYTNGVEVWNKNHVVMPNGSGLLGNASSTQSAIIVKKPGSGNIYYIFTVPACGNGNLTYSVVDMNLQGGLGDITGSKNIPLSGPVTERITAVKHCNNTDIWVITHLWNANTFHVYLVNAAGVNPIPVVSNVGSIHSGSSNFMGYLKASPDGSKLACAIRYMNLFEIFDFNANTGMVSNPMTSPAIYSLIYGIEFSPDASKLYISCGAVTNQIWQFDLFSGGSAPIFSSATFVGSPMGPTVGALQLGPDGKIYVAKYYQNYLGVINNPNALGVACNYVDNGVYLGGKQSQLGLPSFVQSLFKPVITFNTAGNLYHYNDTCYGNQTSFILSSTYGVLSASWNFGDPSSGSLNTSTILNPNHVFTSPGTYNVTVILQLMCGPDTIQKTLQILPSPHVSLNDTSICTGTSIVLGAGNPGSQYKWNTGVTTQTITVSTSGTYSVVVTNSNSCSYVDSCIINVGSYLPVEIPDDTICLGDTLTLDAIYANSTYIWSTGATTQTIEINNPGTYSVTVTVQSGCSGSDIAVISALPTPVVNLPVTGICPGDSVLINAGNPGSFYLWNTGETTQSIYQNSAGNFSVTVTNSYGCKSVGTGSLSWYPSPMINLPDTVYFCAGSNALLDAGNPGATYIWSNGATTQKIFTSKPGNYSVSITSLDGCTATASCELIAYPLPVINNIFDTTMCPGDLIILDAGNPGCSYQWSIGSTNQTVMIAGTGNYSITVTNTYNCSSSVDFIVDMLPLPEVDFGPDKYLCEMKPLVLDAGDKYKITEYLWSTGDTTREITIFNPGLYSVTVTNACGTTKEDILITVDDTCSWALYIPNAFTPNGDGNNDIFKVYGTKNITNYEIIIYNRWGGIMYKSNDILGGWNGKFQGDLQLNDLYTYYITFHIRDENAVRVRTGKVMLLR